MLNLALIVLIMALDWVTPAGIVVGILATIPILLSSVGNNPRHVWLTSIVAMVGFWISAYFGHGPISPAAVWVPNRILAFLALPASCALALILQKGRLQAMQARDKAISAGDLNRLLASLLAHDLRTPMTLASQGFEYVEESISSGRAIDAELISDVRARLRRSLRNVDIILGLARVELPGGEEVAEKELHRAGRLREEIRAEVESFAYEAAARKKVLVSDLEGVGTGRYQVDIRVVRQAIAILLDNAVRYAAPGEIRVTARTDGSELILRMEDQGPTFEPERREDRLPGSSGAGLGLQLCRALAERADGRLEIDPDRERGTRVILRLPAAGLGEREPGAIAPAPTADSAPDGRATP